MVTPSSLFWRTQSKPVFIYLAGHFMANKITALWLTLSCSVVVSCVLSVAFFMKRRSFILLSLFFSVCLYSLCSFLEISAKTTSRQKLFNRIFLNYSIHILIMSLIYMVIGTCPFVWLLAIGISSFYQIINYIVNMFGGSNNQIITIIKMAHSKLTNPPLSRQLLSLFEIMVLFTPIRIKSRSGIYSFLLHQFYLFWIVLYRYSQDDLHRMIWTQLKNQFSGFLNKLPAAIANFLNRVLSSLSSLGDIGLKLYAIKTHEN